MFYLTVTLPSAIVTIIYFIMYFTHARIRSVDLLKSLLLNGAIFFSLIFAQISVFFAVKSFRVNELLSGCFFQLFLQFAGGIFITVYSGKNNTDSAVSEQEKARLLIRGLSEEKKVDFTAENNCEKIENGAILPHREGENSTKGGFNFDGVDELTLNAKKKSSTSLDRENTLKAEQIIERAKTGKQIGKREIENAVDSLIKIVSSKK